MLKAMIMMIIVVISILFIYIFSLTCSSEMSNISHAATNEHLINLLAYHNINIIIIICSVMSMYYEVTSIAIQLKPQQLSSQKKMVFRYSSYTIAGF
jgi:hypothetical protein